MKYREGHVQYNRIRVIAADSMRILLRHWYSSEWKPREPSSEISLMIFQVGSLELQLEDYLYSHVCSDAILNVFRGFSETSLRGSALVSIFYFKRRIHSEIVESWMHRELHLYTSRSMLPTSSRALFGVCGEKCSPKAASSEAI